MCLQLKDIFQLRLKQRIMGKDLGYDDLLLQDLHGVVGATGLLPHQNDFPKRSFSQKLQIVKVIHCLHKQTEERREGNGRRHGQEPHVMVLTASPFVCSGWWTCPSPPRWRSRSGRWGCTGCPPPPAWPGTRPPSGWPRPTRPCRRRRSHSSSHTRNNHLKTPQLLIIPTGVSTDVEGQKSKTPK